MDSHVHLSDYPDASRVVAGAAASGTLLVSQGIDRKTSAESLRLSSGSPATVKGFVGVHPSEALKDPNPGWILEALPGAAGLGEVGLDPKYSETGPGGAQMKVFEMQLRAAEATGKPVQVHTRDAESLCIDVASHYRLGRVLLHWFQGEDRLPEVHDKEYFVSFGPALIYSKKLQRMATAVEREFVLTESDGPVPFAPLGGCQGPSLIPSVIFKLSELWRVGFDEAREIVTSNAIDFLTTTGKG